ncbi:MAG TPA: bifunctional DNA-formamidopyrimidine glycosylase/DNA-(apurinic or apyrimidinic site) lyase [Patescibacteria group bacterium]|nr:bifunctional DNA-formamidopyrimidine glycosylase/DNA-(apurinic or apyrimidinic site) lyase [Patescibacteria group bacterium]
MPELPEVETVRKQLEQNVVGLTIHNVEQKRHLILRGDAKSLESEKNLGARRFGKLLILDLSGGLSLAIHLKMTGRLTLLKPEEPLPEHTHVIFHLTNKERLAYSDYRRFGYIHILPTDKVNEHAFVAKLGKELLKDFTLEDLEKLCAVSKRPIKTLLLDQEKIAGIGNIYACESLWIAKINPKRTANGLQQAEIQRLFASIEEVLKEGIARGGASDNSYRNLFGGRGEYQNFFKVYMREGKPCPRCQTPIQKIFLGGRGTFFCPHCQI